MSGLEPDPQPSPHQKSTEKWIKDLNLRPETLKLLEENMQKTQSYKTGQWMQLMARVVCVGGVRVQSLEPTCKLSSDLHMYPQVNMWKSF